VLVSPVVVILGVPTAPAATVIDVADAAPKVGVTNVGLVANTTAPEPVVLANFAVVTVPSLGVPIAKGELDTTSILLVPVGGAVLNVSVVPETEYVSFS